MTREEFETARRNSAQRYKEEALEELKSAFRPRISANARKRIEIIERIEAMWQASGFWTPETEYSYKTIYERLPSGTPISPF